MCDFAYCTLVVLNYFYTIPTAFLFFAVAGVLLFLPHGRLRAGLLVATPIIAAAQIWGAGLGNFAPYTIFGIDMEAMRLDPLSRIFALIFCFASAIGNLYAWHLRDKTQQIAAVIYAGSALGAVMAGDLLTLFFYWEGTALASVFLIWARGTNGAFHTGMRYLIIQIGSGVLLLGGLILYYQNTGELIFEKMILDTPATWLIFIAFGIKAAFPMLHNWLQDSYPAATVTGTVILSAFTTKLAIYALARGFAGTEILIYIGAIMTLFPIFFAEVENDMRRVLAYSLNNQLGFMVVGIGIGTELALNGTAAHAFVHIIYKALLFMSVGAVLYRTGTSKASELGGLYRTMPLTAIFCIIGALSISAFPLFSGFVAKSLILSSVAESHKAVIWGVLVFASAGVLSHSGIKVPFFTFFGHDSGKRPAEAPRAMLWAMGISAGFCVFIGVYPRALYALLPYAVEYAPYTADHVLAQMQLLVFALAAFVVLYWLGYHPAEKRGVNLDTDVIYRVGLLRLWRWLAVQVSAIYTAFMAGVMSAIERLIRALHNSHGPEGRLAASWPSGAMVLNIAIVLGVCLIAIYIS